MATRRNIKNNTVKEDVIELKSNRKQQDARKEKHCKNRLIDSEICTLIDKYNNIFTKAYDVFEKYYCSSKEKTKVLIDCLPLMMIIVNMYRGQSQYKKIIQTIDQKYKGINMYFNGLKNTLYFRYVLHDLYHEFKKIIEFQ